MKRRYPGLRLWLALASLVTLVPIAFAVPLGYRYIGSRLVSEGRVVFWYWNVDHVEIGPYDVSFVARLYARAIEVNQERPYVAVIRCDSRTYREFGSQHPYVAIDEGEPIHAVWRAGCDAGKAVSLAERHARLNASPSAAAAATGRETGAGMSAATTPTATNNVDASSAATTAPSRAAAPTKLAAAPAMPAPAASDASTAACDSSKASRRNSATQC